jgi:tetratricopeptide (TPR) repeat protein
MVPPALSRPLLLGLALTLLTLAVYRPVLRYDFVNFDDGLYVSSNKTVQEGLTWHGFVYAWQANVASNWHPLTMLSHMLDCQLFGIDAKGHHLTSLLIHLAAVWSLFELLRRMTGAAWRSASVAALFAVHPLHVESVAWIAERKDVLSGLFFVLTLGAWLRFTRLRRPGTGAYFLALLMFGLGLLSKPMLVTVPCVLLLLDVWPLARLPLGSWLEARQALPRLLFEKIPFFVLAATMSAITLYTQQHSLARLEAVSVGRRLGNALVSYVVYLGKTFWPAQLAVFYPLPPSVPVWKAALAAALLAGVTALCLLRLRRSPWLTVGWLWFLGMLVPVIGILQVGRQGMADRYTYLPSIGLFLALVWELGELASRRRVARAVLPALAAASLVVLAVACRIQVTTWKDSATLFRHAIAVTDRNYLAHLNLGVALSHLGNPQEAEAEYRRALAIQPNMMEAQAALGVVLRKQGRPAEALPHVQRAVRLRPDSARLRHTLATVLEDLGRHDAAIAQLRKAVELSPRFADAHDGLGTLLQKQGKTDEALRHFLIALEINPELTDLYAPAGTLLAVRGRLPAALRLFAEAVRRQPRSAVAWYNLAVTLERLGKISEARDAYGRALELDPGLLAARQRLQMTGGLPAPLKTPTASSAQGPDAP